MKKTAITSLVVIVLSLLLGTGCKKKADDSVQTKLIGKWQYVQSANDDNNNGIMDASEVVSLSTYGINYYIIFSTDGRGNLDDGSGSIQSFTWSLTNRDADLVLAIPGSPSNVMHIETLSRSSLTFVQNQGQKSWVILQKQ